ncbi:MULTISPECIES: HBL/NHE enterotoxin family protein [Virgibacillus]|uniref:HBL/NHE enterotoxin family protein n=1 Tax=Virgibacillus dokdonensis TaxID=302167 RepID=A0A2K9IUN7_9BACI|nr:MULTISPECIES: HBL/NHE enterotoxin family protein [Virgibacillus]AUJ23466.1 hemolytic enterotoxin (HBL) [Virgibacillus dokdonensis]NWO12019.1 HBL/NHE enterotoxin family protein [Virgibacillus sp.]
MKKKILSCLMILVVLFTVFIPQSAFAESKESLRNVTFSNWIRTLGSQYPLLQAYGLVILKQPDLNVKNMSSLSNNQYIARNNVREWLDEYSSKLIYINENMNGLTQRVDYYYDRLYDLSEQIDSNEQAKNSFLSRYNRLQRVMDDVQYKMERTSMNLQAYHDLLEEDSNNFSKKADQAIASLNGGDGKATTIRSAIKANMEDIQNELVKILNNPDEVYDFSFKLGTEIYNTVKTGAETKTVDVASIEALGKTLMSSEDLDTKESYSTIRQKHKTVTSLMKQLSEIEHQATEVTITEDQLFGFSSMVERQITIFNYIVNEFTELNHIMGNLKEDIIEGNITPSEIKRQLRYYKDIMDEIDKQTGQFEEFTTSVKY